jgi:hypothetical protein
VRIQIRRRGGFAGIALYAELDTAELGGQTAARVEDAVARLLASAGTPPTPKPDAFEYEITVPGSGESVSVAEHEVPSDLEPLIQKLSEAGHVEARRQPPH